MIHWTNGKRWLSFALAMTMLLSLLCMSASAIELPASGSLEEAKAALADVKITQTYNNKTTDDATHDYRTDGNDVYVTYGAELRMKEEMATYLQARQQQLCSADFKVNMNVELDWLDWTVTGDKLTFTFQSTFLKPVQPANAGTSYSYSLKSYDPATKYFTFEIVVSKAWIQQNWKAGQSFSVPMELIYYSYSDNSGLHTCNIREAAAKNAGGSAMFWDYSVADWMKPITLTLAGLKVKADKAATITANSSTWKTIKASGTVDGIFSYITVEVPTNIAHAARLAANPGYTNTLKFGNDQDIKEWKSNEVKVTLKRSEPVAPKPDKNPEDLNTTDHFAYIIGYPDGEVKPNGNITRAEVATIFFRMLKDEARDKYWSKTNSYTDVKGTDWYNNAISTLSNMGIIDGYPDGSFQPNAGITRAEFAKIAVSFFKDNVRETMGDRFSDISGKWYTEYINLANELAIVNGYPDGTFRPDNKITRAEAMTIVNNTLRRTPCKEGLLPVSVMITWPDNVSTAWYYEAVQEATNSHEYTRASTTDKEQWTKELPVRDWAAFEKAWSDSNSASNPGDVVDGQNGNQNRN